MGWKQIVTPRWLRWWHKRTKHLRGDLVARGVNVSMMLGVPSPLARDVARRHGGARAVLYKQGILRLVAGDRFLRYARRPSAQAKLTAELDTWRRLRDGGLGEWVQRSMELEPLDAGLLLSSELLRPIDLDDQITVSLPILQALVAAARPVVHPALPATIAAGLTTARTVCGGTLPSSFVAESALRETFARPCLTGASHGDLHFRNVMRDAEGRSILIDLKSCVFDQVLAFDLLTFACKYVGARNDRNVIDNAFLLQQRGWAVPELAPVLALVDLPKPLWGPIVTLHALGRIELKKPGRAASDSVVAKLIQRSLSRPWQVA